MNIFIAVLFALLVFEVVKWTAKASFIVPNIFPP